MARHPLPSVLRGDRVRELMTEVCGRFSFGKVCVCVWGVRGGMSAVACAVHIARRIGPFVDVRVARIG